MKKILITLSVLIILIIGMCIYYNVNISSVSKDSKLVSFMVDSGSNYYSVISKLKKEGLIKNEFCFKLYVKFNKVNDLQAGTYTLSKSMSVEDIVKEFNKGNTYNPDSIVITFKEGINMRSIASIISENTNNTLDDVYATLNDKTYLLSLINEYWFINDSILNENIYYSLEGYLYPNTYEFTNKDVSVKDIFKKMLDEMNNKLIKYKGDLNNSSFSIHEILTLASIVELEGKANSDRAGIAGVFINRLEDGWSLGSDVTTYYAAKIELSDRDLYQYELNDKNNYNTRSNYLAGKLPIGPICNSSIESIVASLHPIQHQFYFFVSDINGKTYFSKTNSEHESIKADLIEDNLWYTYN